MRHYTGAKFLVDLFGALDIFSPFFFYMNSSIKNQARTWARYRGKCPKCADAIELNDPIVDVYINDQGKTWDCKTM